TAVSATLCRHRQLFSRLSIISPFCWSKFAGVSKFMTDNLQLYCEKIMNYFVFIFAHISSRLIIR
ncbi:hypothetical protein L9F63_027376, partial [Diploptera punctata]